jgi:hypothetical protein
VAISFYDADGNKVAQINNGVATYYFMGGSYEVTGEAVTKYYALAGEVVAVRDAAGLKYLLTDHLGSVVTTTNESGALVGQQRYLPFAGVRTDLAAPNYRIGAIDHTYTGKQANSYISNWAGGQVSRSSRSTLNSALNPVILSTASKKRADGIPLAAKTTSDQGVKAPRRASEPKTKTSMAANWLRRSSAALRAVRLALRRRRDTSRLFAAVRWWTASKGSYFFNASADRSSAVMDMGRS